MNYIVRSHLNWNLEGRELKNKTIYIHAVWKRRRKYFNKEELELLLNN
jgi:hypothetical protein